MTKNQKRLFGALPAISLVCASCLTAPVQASPKDIGNKGAQVYCFMRTTGNDHEVSWNAAYEVIKRQKSSLFKTSPKHAAVMIIETVVDNPQDFKNCGSYLGNLFNPSDLTITQEKTQENTEEIESGPKKGDRYSY